MRPAFLLSATLAAGVLAGCGSGTSDQPAFPELLPVSGVVNQGGKPVTGGDVRFTPEPTRSGFMYTAEVGADGRFTLQTVRTTDGKGERKPGAPAGQYKVVYVPVMVDQAAGTPEPAELRQPVTVDPKATDLKLDFPAPKKK
jgi:hypothetical protein